MSSLNRRAIFTYCHSAHRGRSRQSYGHEKVGHHVDLSESVTTVTESDGQNALRQFVLCMRKVCLILVVLKKRHFVNNINNIDVVICYV